MLVRLMYASRANETVGADPVASILSVAKANNAKAGITGVLCFCSSSGIFMQVLEGGRSPVNALYGRIVRDTRHRDATLLSYEEISERHFAGWTMGKVDMDRLNAALVLRYSESATLDPYAISGHASLALFDELVATASISKPG